MAAMPVIPERAALVEVLLAEMAATAATAATAGRLMEATRLVALGDRALTAARRPEAMAATEGVAAVVAGAGEGGGDTRTGARAAKAGHLGLGAAAATPRARHAGAGAGGGARGAPP